MVTEMNRVEDYMNLPYKKTLVRNQDGTYFAYVKEFQGCMTEGDTPSEAYTMLEDAMESWIEAALEDGDAVPEPEITLEKEFSGRTVLRMPKSLQKKLSEEAKVNNVSWNTWAVMLLAQRNSTVHELRLMNEKLLGRLG